jgi:two-component system chemotaxis response regulator CheY
MAINIDFFKEDANNQLINIHNVLFDIQKGTNDKEKIGELFRAIHTLKGAADMFNFTNIVNLTHKAEDLLDKIRANKVRFDTRSYELFIELKIIIEQLVNYAISNTSIDSNLEVSIVKIQKQLLEHEITNKISIETKEVQNIKKAKTILVVDDASMIRNLASKTAEANGFEVLTAQDGQEGIDILYNNHIDLIFTDENMPQMNGLQMVAKIREDAKYEFLPIVMLTTEKKEELKKQGKALGVKAWLVKPFNKNKFLMVLEKLLG